MTKNNLKLLDKDEEQRPEMTRNLRHLIAACKVLGLTLDAASSDVCLYALNGANESVFLIDKDCPNMELEKKYLAEAIKSDPNGAVCHFCGEPNDMVDDCGFWYIIDPREPETRDETGFLRNKTHAACTTCYSEHSWKHHKLYGVGDR